jgi:tRNA A-37 threonylcarbamoyl transferase component Bud32/Tfp pilus assembly protein PilZ
MEQGTAVTPEDVALTKGETYKDMGLLAEAISEFAKALSDKSLQHRASRRIAACMLDLNLPDQAERVLLRSLCLPDISKKDRLWIYSDLVDLYVKLGRIEAALERLIQMRNDDDGFVPDLAERIEALYTKIDFREFERHLEDLQNSPLGTTAKLADSPPAAEMGKGADPRRRASRYRFSNLVQYSFDQSVWYSGYSNDISILGIFVLTHQPVPVGSIAFLKFHLPASIREAPVEIIGHVVRQENKQGSEGGVLGMGVHFVAVDRQLKRHLALLVKTLSAEEKKAHKKTAVIRSHCDSCGRILTFSEAMAGQKGACACGKTVPVPVVRHSPTTENPLRGFHLAGCRIDRVIGKGSVATVYKGHHLTLDIPVAIKILSATQKLAGSQLAERFLKEARVIARINHANIVAVMNAGEEHGHRFIVMQYVPGRTLGDVLIRRNNLKSHDLIRIFLDVCDALQAAHEHSMVHGDVKPANILLTGEHRAMLVDFGLVKDLATYQQSDDRGKTLGTPLYMSPEQARGEREVDFRSDIYSLAATMYHVLAGEPPFGGLTAKEVIRKHMEDPLPVPTRLPLPVPERMWEIIARAMEKKPENRYQSVKELKEALLQVSRSVTAEELKPRHTSQRKK